MITPATAFRAAAYRSAGALLFVLLAAAPTAVQAQEERPSAAGDPRVEDEDQRISEYDFAVSHAVRALMAADPEQGRVTVYVARKEGALWHVYFGSYDVRRSVFRIVYEVVQQAESSERFAVRKYREEVPADAELNRQATALVTALQAFEPRDVRFHTYVWRNADGQWVAYFVPVSVRRPLQEGPGQPAIDQRVLVSPDARQILETRNYPATDSVEWITPPSNPKLGDLLPLLLDPQLAPFRLISQSLVCEINWRGEFESCLIAPPR